MVLVILRRNEKLQHGQQYFQWFIMHMLEVIFKETLPIRPQRRGRRRYGRVGRERLSLSVISGDWCYL